MIITVAICTWNRSALLRQTLERMTGLVPPRATWRLLVVNNACTDDTDSVIADFRSALPLERIWQPVAGHSNARNAAVDAADGDYLVWTDDDVLVDPEWLRAYEAAFSEHGDGSFFGGPVRPWFEGTPPGWLTDAWELLSSVYAVRDLGSEPFACDERLIPYGANYAIRLDVQRRHRYDPRLGRVGTGLVSGDEVTVLREILREGGTGWWVPNAGVEHFIPASRQTLHYVRGYLAGIGEWHARESGPDSAPSLFGRPRWEWRQALQCELSWRLGRAFGKPARTWARDLVGAATARGRLRVRRTRAEDDRSIG